MKFFIVIASLFVLVSACSSKPAPAEKKVLTAPTTLEQAVQAEYRTPEWRARDVYRHPVETLTFFGLKPNMTVLEIGPSSGWYTQILAPYLNTSGQYIAVQVPSSMSDYMKSHNEKRTAWLEAHKEITSNAKVVDFGAVIAPDNSADMVLTFRNVHNWDDKAAAFKSFFKALKPGGVLGVVDHRADPKNKKNDPSKSGYITEKEVIALAQKAGFRLASKSEINANPKDTKNYEKGVWTLPPSLKLGDVDKDKYMAIGESDRMTLKFVKK